MSPRNRDASTGRGRGQPRMLALMTQTTPPAVALDNVHKHFGSVRAVDGITLTINPGEVVAFLGPNGAGKTTTIDMMLGLGKPSSGTNDRVRQHPGARHLLGPDLGGHADRRAAQGPLRRGDAEADPEPVLAHPGGG